MENSWNCVFEFLCESCFRLVFSQSLLSLDIIEDFLHHIDEVNQNAEEGEKKEGEEGEKKDDKAKENGVAAGGSGEGASGSGEGASGSGDSAEKKTEKKEDKVKRSGVCAFLSAGFSEA